MREECFVIEQVPTEGPEATVVGMARLRRLELDDGSQVEWDVLFPSEQTRVLHVERRTSRAATLVWRELRPGSGRTLSTEWIDRGAALSVREWGGRQPQQVELQAAEGGCLPLQVLEELRAGELEPGTLRVFDPLSRAFETLCLREPELDGVSRRFELVREDGTLAAAWSLAGDGLVAFQWQGGSLQARRIPAEEYRRLLEPGPEPQTQPVPASSARRR